MEETMIRPGYTMPTETDGTPADYSAIEAAVNAHNQNAQPGEAYWGIRLCGAEYEVYEYGKVPQPPTAEELAAQVEAKKKAEEAAAAEAKKKAELETVPGRMDALEAANDDLVLMMADLIGG